MKKGDTLVYANGKTTTILSFPTLDGKPAVQLKEKLFADRFKLKSEVEAKLKSGEWSLNTEKKEKKKVTRKKK